MAKDAESGAGPDAMTAFVDREMTAAIRGYRRFCSGFRLYFTLYGDPLSDDIMSDIQHQAETFAWQQVRKMEAAHV